MTDIADMKQRSNKRVKPEYKSSKGPFLGQRRLREPVQGD
jgi:hypothetical protein